MKTPIIFWFRSDLRLADNPGLVAACATGNPVIPVYILDDENPGIWKMGGASRWWLHQSLKALDQSLQDRGFHPLVLLKGDAEKEITKVVSEASASDVFWNRCYEPWAIKRDTAIKDTLKKKGIAVESSAAYLLFEPWLVKNKTGGSYKVFTPFYKTCLENAAMIRKPISTKVKSTLPAKKIKGLKLADLDLMPKIKWYKGMQEFWQPGEAGAQARLQEFLEDGVGQYKAQRDLPAVDGVSRLSPHLHFGEISPHQIWATANHKIDAEGSGSFANHAEGFLRQLFWRDFSWHLLYHDPEFPEQPWNKQFAKFKWQWDEEVTEKWRRGMTGYPIVDAGMRQLWQTGWMHNRVRMIVGSFLVKNLLQHWRAGEDWFWDTLVDADLGNNAAGWQWIAGCGADAAPYFRIFNPVTQSKKFDPDGEYIKTYVPELADLPTEFIHTPWEAPPLIAKTIKSYPSPVVDLAASRDRALEAYAASKTAA